jgi:citrate lyase beta subunit
MRSDPIHPAELGGTLFVPATHPQLEAVIGGTKYPQLRSAVIDLEDGIDRGDLPAALDRVESLLPSLEPSAVLRFIRPDSPQTLERLLAAEGIERIDGFVLPKFGLENADKWLTHLYNTPFAFMPSIEGADLFSRESLVEIAEMLKPMRERIPTVRFGLEDLMRQLGIARDCNTPLYGLVAPAQVIASMLTAFKPLGFSVSGGVYKCFQDSEGFNAELEADLKQGLLSKTIIHPSQIGIVEETYKVHREEKAHAEAIVRASTNVSAARGIMLERPTQLPWAETILKRAALYGVK